MSIRAGRLQVGLAAVGSVEITPALESIAKHNPVEGHETPTAEDVKPMLLAELHVGVAASGLVVISASPPPSTATHSDDDAHEIPVR